MLRTGRLAYGSDVKAVADAIGNADKIAALKPLEWLEKDMATGKISAGVLTF